MRTAPEAVSRSTSHSSACRFMALLLSTSRPILTERAPFARQFRPRACRPGRARPRLAAAPGELRSRDTPRRRRGRDDEGAGDATLGDAARCVPGLLPDDLVLQLPPVRAPGGRGSL